VSASPSVAAPSRVGGSEPLPRFGISR
jgi:hypothetical protein